MMNDLGIPGGYAQDANPYQGRGRRSYQDEARQRALATAVSGGQQPEIPSLANQPPAVRQQQAPTIEPERLELIPGSEAPESADAPSAPPVAGRPQRPQRAYGRGAAGSLIGGDSQQVALQNAVRGTGNAGPGAPPPGAAAPPPAAAPPSAAPPAASAPNPAWNTKGYAAPAVAPTAAGMHAPRGWDDSKFQDPNAQQPKYVIGRALQSAAGGDDLLQTQAERDAAIAAIQAAYPGSTFDGKDHVNVPGVGNIDIFEGAGDGLYRASYQLDEGTGLTADGQPLPSEGGGSAYPDGFVSNNRIRSNNTQEGGDALQAIYELLGPLMGDITKGNALQGALKGALR